MRLQSEEKSLETRRQRRSTLNMRGGTIVKMYETEGEYFMWDLVYERVQILPVAI